MKKVLLLATIFLVSLSTFAQTGQKSGYVDSQVILQQFPPAIKAQSDLEALAASWKGELDSLAMNFQTEYANFQKQATTMTPDKQREAQQKLVTQQQSIQQLEMDRFGQNGLLAKKQEELLLPIRQKIIDAIAEIAKEEGFNFVFDKVGDAIVLFADAQFDITFKVLDRLKRGK